MIVGVELSTMSVFSVCGHQCTNLDHGRSVLVAVLLR